jgi:hypothetical protein
MPQPFQLPETFEQFTRMTQADLHRMREIENAAQQLRSHVLDTIQQHAHLLISEQTKTETYSWRGTPILQISYNQQCPPERLDTDYITLTRLV